PIQKTPYIILAEGWIRRASKSVGIEMPPEQERLADYSITAATLSIAMSPTLQGKYSVEVTNLTQVLGPVAIRASAEAKRTYEMQPLPLMTLYIFDDDVKQGQAEQRRRVVYNFPDEFVAKDEIELKNPEQPMEAKFRLISLAGGGTLPSGAD
ncbi:MAG: hypothetical protein JW720_05570, partial [Sedimentisphaerales bacterium]|nr:hypothetical protein [Sedimentisphaerales bacterium]